MAAKPKLNNLRFLIKEAKVLIDKRDYSGALEYINLILTIHHKSSIAFYLKGHVLNLAGRHKEAVEALDESLDINPHYAEAWCEMGLALNDMRKYGNAIECFKKALRINTQYIDAWNNLGVAYNNKRNYKKAKKCFEKAQQLKKNLKPMPKAELGRKGSARNGRFFEEE